MSEKRSELLVVAQETFTVGKEVEIFGDSPNGRYSTVFEDDGQTGYFYACDAEKPDNQICDAVHIYNVKDVVDKEIPSEAEIVWSKDGTKSALLINNYPHAVFDFTSKRGYCRTNFPSSSKNWTEFEHEWSDEALELFK
jgi:hypothetical protein